MDAIVWCPMTECSWHGGQRGIIPVKVEGVAPFYQCAFSPRCCMGNSSPGPRTSVLRVQQVHPVDEVIPMRTDPVRDAELRVAVGAPPPRPLPSRFVVLHDGENAFIPPDSRRGYDIYADTLREAVAGLCGAAGDGFNPLTLPRGAVTWHYVFPIRRWSTSKNRLYQPRSEVLCDLQDLGGVHMIDPGDKPGRTDVKLMELMNEFLYHHDCMDAALKARTAVIVLSGDRDFASNIRAVTACGFPVVVIHSADCARSSLSAVATYVSNKWLDIVGAPVAVAGGSVVPHAPQSHSRGRHGKSPGRGRQVGPSLAPAARSVSVPPAAHGRRDGGITGESRTPSVVPLSDSTAVSSSGEAEAVVAPETATASQVAAAVPQASSAPESVDRSRSPSRRPKRLGNVVVTAPAAWDDAAITAFLRAHCGVSAVVKQRRPCASDMASVEVRLVFDAAAHAPHTQGDLKKHLLSLSPVTLADGSRVSCRLVRN